MRSQILEKQKLARQKAVRDQQLVDLETKRRSADSYQRAEEKKFLQQIKEEIQKERVKEMQRKQKVAFE